MLQIVDQFIKDRQLIRLAGGDLDGFFLQLGFHFVREGTQSQQVQYPVIEPLFAVGRQGNPANLFALAMPLQDVGDVGLAGIPFNIPHHIAVAGIPQ